MRDKKEGWPSRADATEPLPTVFWLAAQWPLPEVTLQV